MTILQAFFLGLIQGLTEFLPISSSGHLALAQYLFGFTQLHDFVLFDLICHMGTLFAILYVFSYAIKDLFTFKTNRFWQLMIATLPLFPLVLILKPLKNIFDQPQFLGPCFLVTALLLWIGLYWRLPIQTPPENRKWRDSLTIGLFQAIAILPGISRSGATISAAQLLGWQKERAVQFSFLLAIPAILGGTFLEGWKAWHTPTESFSMISPIAFLVGFVTSFIVGSVTLKFLMRLIIQEKWIYFAWYCFFLGITTTFYFNLL